MPEGRGYGDQRESHNRPSSREAGRNNKNRNHPRTAEGDKRDRKNLGMSPGKEGSRHPVREDGKIMTPSRQRRARSAQGDGSNLHGWDKRNK